MNLCLLAFQPHQYAAGQTCSFNQRFGVQICFIDIIYSNMISASTKSNNCFYRFNSLLIVLEIPSFIGALTTCFICLLLVPTHQNSKLLLARQYTMVTHVLFYKLNLQE